MYSGVVVDVEDLVPGAAEAQLFLNPLGFWFSSFRCLVCCQINNTKWLKGGLKMNRWDDTSFASGTP